MSPRPTRFRWLLAPIVFVIIACGQPTAAVSPNASAGTDPKASAASAYLKMADKLNTLKDKQRLNKAASVDQVVDETAEEMAILREDGPLVDWPSESKPYADNLLKAADAMQALVESYRAHSTSQPLLEMAQQTSLIRIAVAGLRKSLGLPPPTFDSLSRPRY